MASGAVSSSSKDVMNITVSDPLKHSEGMNAYITYKVTTKTNLERFDSESFYCHRRYSDFVWLQERLTEMYPGIIIPPLPEKHVMRRFSEPFLSQRQRSLQKFLQRIASHELLRDNRCVKAFLELESLDATKESMARESKKNDKSFWQWASDATSSLSAKVAGTSYKRPKTEEDLKFDEIKQYVTSLEPQVNAVHKHTHQLVDKGKEMAQALFDFGLAFTLLGQAESDALGEAMAQLGQCADKLSRITAVEADKETQFFDEPIKDYVRLVKQVKQMLDVRTSKLTTYEAMLGELESKKLARGRISGQVGADPQLHANKLAQAEEDLRIAQENVDIAKKDYEMVTKRVFAEMDRFKREKLIDFKSIVLDYVQLQIEYNQQVEQSWREVLPALQALNMQQGGNRNNHVNTESNMAQPSAPPSAPIKEDTANGLDEVDKQEDGGQEQVQGKEANEDEDGEEAFV